MATRDDDRRLDRRGVFEMVEAVDAIARAAPGCSGTQDVPSILDVVVAGALRACTVRRARRHSCPVAVGGPDAAASDPGAAGLAHAQVRLGEGPALDAATGATLA